LTRSEGQLERSDSKSIILPSYITNNLPLVASLLASSVIPTPFAIRFAHCRGKTRKYKGKWEESGKDKMKRLLEEGKMEKSKDGEGEGGRKKKSKVRRIEERSNERRLERSYSKNVTPPSYITNNHN